MQTEQTVNDKKKRRQQHYFENSRKQRIARFLYNKENGTCCARTPCGWLKCLTYYILFLLIAGVIFLFLSWYAVYGTDPKDPRFNKKSLIKGGFPGITFIGSNIDHLQDSIIWYTTYGTVDTSYKRGSGVYANIFSGFIKDQVKACGDKNGCIFNNKTLGPCGRPDYGFSNKTPCIFLKLGRLHGWKPKRFKETPGNLPAELKKRINTSRSCLWVNCRGVRTVDTDNMGPLSYYPEPAFHEDYFPQNNNLHPVIALHLKNIKPQYLVHLQCELYAENVSKKPNKISNVILYTE